MRFFGLLLILSFRLFAEPAYLTFPSDIDWKSMDSPHFEIIYRAGQNSFALRTLKAAERAHRLLTTRFPDSPPKTYIVLADFQDSLNGYSLDFPYPHMVIFASPPESWGELSSLDGWLTSVVLHEFVHTLHLFPANGAWKWLRSIFGTWVLPNGMLPSHLHEGLATFFETHFSQGGRGRSSIFSMYGRKSVETGKDDEVVFPLDGLDGSVSKWPHGTSPYYFGYFLYENLWKKKQDRGFYDLTLNTSKNWPYFVNSPFEETYGMDLPSLWEEIRNSQKDKHAKEISHLKTTPLSKLNYLTHTQFLKRELHLAPSNKELAFVSASPEKPIRIERIDSETGFPTKAHELALSGASGLCWNQTGETDYFVVSLSRSENFYSTHTVQVFNSDTNQTTPLQTASGQLEHVHQFDCSSDFNSIVTYQEQGGIGKLLVYQGNLLSADTSLQKTREWILPENSWVSSVLYGSEIYFLLREDTRSYLFRWDLSSTPVKLDTFKGHAHQLRRDKNRLFFISSSSGRDEVWEWHSRSKTKTKRVNLVGGVNSFAQQGETFWISSFETGGYDIAKVSGLQLVDDTLPQKEENSAPLLETVSASENSYSPWETLIPRTWVPSALFVNYGFQLGAWIPMFDLSQKHFYDLNLGIDHRELIDGTKTLPFASASYGYRFGRSFVAQASAYSIPGFLTIARSFFQRWGGTLSLSSNLGSLPIQARISGVVKKIEDSDLGAGRRSVGAGLELGWSNATRTNALEASINKGIRLAVGHTQYLTFLGSAENFFSTLMSFDGYLPSPLWSESNWYLGLRQGYTEGTPLYNSFFEGGGELLFSQGRGVFLNRGYLQGSFAARRIFGGNLEFRFPISRIERGISLWPLFLKNLSGAIVLDSTSFDYGGASVAPKTWLKTFLWSTGIEIKSQWKFFYYLPTQVRFGAYRGLSTGGEDFYFTTAIEASL